MRIASVLPSATEIVAALGSQRDLVARSDECDFPPEIRELPVLMRARRQDPESRSSAIDRQVREARGRGESLYEIDLEVLRATRPEVLLTQDLCGVCSITGEEVARACAEAEVSPRIVSLTPTRLESVWETILTVGEAIGRRDEAVRLVKRLHSRSARSAPTGLARRVAVVEWLDPLLLAGLWTPDVITAAGATSVGPAAGETALRLGWEELGELGPDLILLSPCSFPVGRTLRELEDPDLAEAVRRGSGSSSVFIVDEAFFSRPGPRLADGVDLVRYLLGVSPTPPPMPFVAYRPLTPVRAG